MTRVRTEAMVVRATNNIYTVLSGVACLAVLIALVIVFVRFRELTGGETPLFFGIF